MMISFTYYKQQLIDLDMLEIKIDLNIWGQIYYLVRWYKKAPLYKLDY